MGAGLSPSLREWVDPNGLVDIWIFATKRWCKMMPVDARDAINWGSGALEGPEPKPWPDLRRDPPLPQEIPVSEIPRMPTAAGPAVVGFPEPVKTKAHASSK